MKSFQEYLKEEYDERLGGWTGGDFLKNIVTMYTLSDFNSRFDSQYKKISEILKQNLFYPAGSTYGQIKKTFGNDGGFVCWEDDGGNQCWISYFKDTRYILSRGGARPYPEFSFISRILFDIRGKDFVVYNAGAVLTASSHRQPLVGADQKRMYALHDYCTASINCKTTKFKIDMVDKEYDIQLKELKKFITSWD